MDEKKYLAEAEDEIDLLELWYLFLRKLKFIIMWGVIGCVIAGGFTHFFIAPTYKATSKLYVVSASSDSVINLSDLQLGSSLAKDYQELVLGRPMLESVIENLKLSDMTVDQLKNMITVVNPSNTRLLNIMVESTDPVQARDIANEMAELSVKWLPAVMETNAPNIAEEAITPQKKASPSLTKNTLIGGMALAALYFGVCVVQFLMDDSIKSADDMEKYFGIVPLTTVPEDKSISWGDSDDGSAASKLLRKKSKKRSKPKKEGNK